MQKVYTKKLWIVLFTLCFPLAGLLAQQCTSPGANCSSIAQNFNSGDAGFNPQTNPPSVGDFVYSATTGDFRSTSPAPNISYVLTSPRYVLVGSAPVTIGFDLSKSTINPSAVTRITLSVHYEFFVINLAGDTVWHLGAAQTQFTGFCSNVCAQVSDPRFTAGFNVLFRLTIETNSTAAGGSIVVDNFSNGAAAAPLPVDLRAFVAKRNNSSVVLSWETVTESNVKGFEIQRKSGNGSFEKIGFVDSKAPNGNSNSTLQYNFIDLNNNNSAASQYRIVSVDLDGRTKISIIRVVDGLKGLAKIMIYPNPSNGPVNVVFPNSDARDIQVSDQLGRVHASWRSYKNQDLVLNKLAPGFYVLRVTNVFTNQKEVFRLTVTK
jgi:hypothetical protein